MMLIHGLAHLRHHVRSESASALGPTDHLFHFALYLACLLERELPKLIETVELVLNFGIPGI